MSFIKADKISYSYPVIDDTDEFDTKKKLEETEKQEPKKKQGENALKDVSIIRCFSGFRPYTPDGLSMMGEVRTLPGVEEVLNLKAHKKYKINVQFKLQ